MAAKHRLRCDQGSTFYLPLRVANQVAGIVGVTNVASPTITTTAPHGLEAGDPITVSEVLGATGVNNSDEVPEWLVASAPTATTFTIATGAPGVYTSGGSVARPQDLAGYTARMQIRPEIESTVIVVEATTANGRILISAPDGATVINQVAITLAASITTAIAAGPYRYDIEIESPGGFVTRLLQGAFIVNAEVTRA